MSMLFVLLLLVLAVALTTYGQDKVDKPGTAEEQGEIINIEDLVYRVKGADIPRYHLVDAFLARANSGIRNAKDESLPTANWFYGQFLEEIGVKRGSSAEDALRRAAERYGLWAYGPSGPRVEKWEETSERRDGTVVPATVVMSMGEGDNGPQLSQKDDPVLQAEAQAFHVKQAQALADIYYELLADLEESGVSRVKIERYLFNEIAAHTSLASDEPLDSPRIYERAFEERLKVRESGQLPSQMEE